MFTLDSGMQKAVVQQFMLELPYVEVFWTCPLLQASELCLGGVVNFTKMSRFLVFVDSHT
jgi:hypothetical protein